MLGTGTEEIWEDDLNLFIKKESKYPYCKKLNFKSANMKMVPLITIHSTLYPKKEIK